MGWTGSWDEVEDEMERIGVGLTARPMSSIKRL